jgi:subtilase family serine protease
MVGLAAVPRPAAGATPLIRPEHRTVCSEAAPGYARCYAEVVAPSPTAAFALRPFSVTNPAIADAFNPLRFRTAYALPRTAPPNRTVAIVTSFDNPKILADLNVWNARWGLGAFKLCTATVTTSCLKKVNQDGRAAPLPPVDPGWALETALDVQTVHGLCQTCKILVVEASSSGFSNLAVAENTAVTLGANVVSNSWGLEEAYYRAPAGVVAAFNHPGMPITVSSGDLGYEVTRQNRYLGPSFPASLNTVVAVGGTSLTLDGAGKWFSETAWNGSGSGCSLRYSARPPQNTSLIGNWPKTHCGSNRAVADVSAVADPGTGAGVYDSTGAVLGQAPLQSGWFEVGGTSLASPVIAATYALAGNLPPGVQYPAALLYTHKASLHDPTLGSNGSCKYVIRCQATTGYDLPTGQGTPKGLGAF